MPPESGSGLVAEAPSGGKAGDLPVLPAPDALAQDEDQQFIRRVIEAAIRLLVLGWIVVWCHRIASPFFMPILWGAVMAVAIYPVFCRCERALGGRKSLVAWLFAGILLTALIVPSVMMADSLISSVRETAEALRSGSLLVPPPSPEVKEWPVVGPRIHEVWSLASENLREAVRQLGPQLTNVGKWLLGVVAETGIAVLQFALASVVAALFLAHSESSARVVRAFAVKLAPETGLEYTEVAEKTLRSVVVGVLGVALLQGVLAGIGFVVADVPAAGLLTLLCIVLAVIQVGVVIVMLGVTVWMFSTGDTGTATAFLVWTLVVAPLDNILRPLVLGRGANVPMLVVIIGALGGFISAGLIGLFLGGVIFSVGYQLFKAWVGLRQVPAPSVAPADPSPPDLPASTVAEADTGKAPA